MCPLRDRLPWLVTALLGALAGFCGCSKLVGADFEQAHPRPSADPLLLVSHLKAPRWQQTSAEFGFAIAVDARGFALTAPFQDVDLEAGLAVKGGAAYVFDVTNVAAPPWALVSPDVEANDGVGPGSILPKGFHAGDFGALSVALSDQFVVVGDGAKGLGATQSSGNGAPQAGAVYVYNRAAPGSAPQYIKSPNPQPGALFGLTVSLSGSRLAVGAPLEDAAAIDSGTVYVYESRDGHFDDSSPATVRPEVAHEGDAFGMAMAIDGDLLVVGAPGESSKSTGIDGDPTDTSAPQVGAAYVYRLVNGQWNPEHYVKPGASRSGEYFGLSIALSNGRMAVGAPWASNCPSDSTFSRQGVVYVYRDLQGASSVAGGARPSDASTSEANVASLESCLSAPGAFNLFGWSVALLGDQLVVGAPWNYSARADDPTDTTRPYSGAAHLYQRDPAGQWTERAFIKAPDVEANDVFGLSVALAPGLLAVGAPFEAGGPHDFGDLGHYSGAGYLYSTEGPADAQSP